MNDRSTPAIRSAPRDAASPWRVAGALMATLLVFAAAMALVSLSLRAGLREQVLRREGEVLHTVALMQRDVVEETTRELGLEGVDQSLEVALHTSKMRGVLAVRLFDAAGAFLDAVPVEVFETTLEPAAIEPLANGNPVVRFHARFALDTLFITEAPGVRAPALEVEIPLQLRITGEAGAFVQYWIDGSAVAAEFARIDVRVARQAVFGFAVGSLLIVGAIAWAFLRLAAANRLLRRQARDLAQVNRELAQSARTASRRDGCARW
jgi:hypothetical protein